MVEENVGEAQDNVSNIHPAGFPYSGPYPAIDGLNYEALREECKIWRNIWTWMPEEVKDALSSIGKDVRLVLRTNQGYIGTMLMGKFEQKTVELRAWDRLFNQADNRQHWEDKTLVVPVSGIGHLEYIHEDIPEVEEVDEGLNGTFGEDFGDLLDGQPRQEKTKESNS